MTARSTNRKKSKWWQRLLARIPPKSRELLKKILAKLWGPLKCVWKVVAAVVVGLILTEFILSVPPMEIVLQELRVDVPADGEGLVIEPEFLTNVSALAVTVGTNPDGLPSPTAVAFDTRSDGACRSFQVIYSTRNRQNPTAKPTVRIRPRALNDQSCTAILDARSPTSQRRFVVPADSAIDLVLKAPSPDPLLDNQLVTAIGGPALDARGGLFALVRTEVRSRQSVAVRGKHLAIESLSVSDADPDGALRMVLVVKGKSVPSATIGDTNLSLIHRIKIIMQVASKLGL